MFPHSPLVCVDFIADNDYCLDHVIDLLSDPSQFKNDTHDKNTNLNTREIINQYHSGLCVACSTTIIKTMQDQVYNLNPVFLWNIEPKRHSSDGMTIRNCCKLLYKYGIPTYNTYKNTQPLLTGMKNDEAITTLVLEDAFQHKIKAYGHILLPETIIKAFQIDKQYGTHIFGGFILLLPIYHNGIDFWKPVPDVDKISQYEKRQYHAITIIDYDSEHKRFLLQNSLGSNWGNKGNTYFPLSDWPSSVLQVWFITSSTTLKRILTDRQQKKIFTDSNHNNRKGHQENDDTSLKNKLYEIIPFIKNISTSVYKNVYTNLVLDHSYR